MIPTCWLAQGFPLPDGSRHKQLIAASDDWQIILNDTDAFALLVNPAIFEKWMQSALIDADVFKEFEVSGTSYLILMAKPGFLISSAQQGPYPVKAKNGMAFASALRQTRKLIGNVSLHDAIFVEQLSRLLPTYTQGDGLDDRTVLGTWLSAGVQISTSSFHRLCELVEWMDESTVREIIGKAGFSSSGIKYRTDSREGENCEGQGEHRPGRILPPDAHFSLPGRPELEAFLNEKIVEIVANEDKYRRMGIEFPAAIILHGPPGCGKTFAVEKLIEFLDWPSFSIDSGSIGSTYIHETSKKIAEVFDEAIANAPSVIVIDEMEAFLTERVGAHQHHIEEVAEFLRRIPGATKNRVLVIAMTNMLNSIDPAILRRGRFDHIVEVKMPSAQEIRSLLTSLLAKLPTSEDIDINILSQELAEHPMSDVTFILKEAGRIAIKRGKDIIDNASVIEACSELTVPKGTKRRIGF